MVGDSMREIRSHVVTADHINKKLAQLVSPFDQPARLLGEPRLIAEECRIELAQHRCARAAGHNDVGNVGKGRQQPPGQTLRLGPESITECDLATARLRPRKLDFDAEATEHGHGGLSHLWEELIDKAGNKECGSHRESIGAPERGPIPPGDPSGCFLSIGAKESGPRTSSRVLRSKPLLNP